MTASATETAILAIVQALKTAAEAEGAKVPSPARNEDLVSQLETLSPESPVQHYLNVLDGDREDPDELLGADLGNTRSYEIRHRVRVEYATVGGASAERETAFDEGRTAIWDAVKPTQEGGATVYLGGAVSGLQLVQIMSHENTTVAGLPSVKACEFVFELLFTSDKPF